MQPSPKSSTRKIAIKPALMLMDLNSGCCVVVATVVDMTLTCSPPCSNSTCEYIAVPAKVKRRWTPLRAARRAATMELHASKIENGL
jgi:hypothetical protein